MNPNLKLNKIISNSSVYGVVWSGKFKTGKHSNNCVLKLVVLSSGKTKRKCFEHDDEPPFLHTEFTEKKHMSEAAFTYEVEAYRILSRFGLAPKVYDFGIIKKFPIHYGYIISEKMDCSVKDILLKRELVEEEKEKVKNIISKLHSQGIAHGDMKPSNIGVYLEDNLIKECYFFDCSKVRYASNCSKEEFLNYTERDIRNYKKHYIKNITEDRHS